MQFKRPKTPLCSLGEGLLLLVGLFTIVATSVSSDFGQPLKPGNYSITSDCPGAQTNHGTTDADSWNNRFVTSSSSSTPTPTPTPTTTATATLAPDSILDAYHNADVLCRSINESGSADFIMWVCHDKTSNELVCTITIDLQRP